MSLPKMPTRSQILRTLTLGDRKILIKSLESLGELPELRYLRRPEKGLIMVRGRVGGTGAPFNLGEMLVTRCSVSIEGFIGHGYVISDDPEKALAVAAADALYQNPRFTEAIAGLLNELATSLSRAQAAQQSQVASTVVEFFTMVRGDND
ncbi:MAG: phosphonate C-P lyase system protein PhnG [Deltaproteobacteria bacterium]|jgi:alpha-D-ribose 1-methylphosphonate 5-triphosphate synthase subunit PhnG|nr:phosphonate C-P lyase system protein PhnG [Deltaproteobacteria bacterium]